MNARDAFNAGFEDLDELYARSLEWEKKQRDRLMNEEKSNLLAFGFREHEAQAWLENEPDFAKRIVTAARIYSTKRRLDVTLEKVTRHCRLVWRAVYFRLVGF